MDSHSTLLRTAHVVRLIINHKTAELEWEGFITPIEKMCGGTLPANLDSFLSFLHPQYVDKIVSELDDCNPSSGVMTFKVASEWIYTYHCAPGEPNQIFIHCIQHGKNDPPNLETPQALNARLQLGMAEAHHRVKNTLQNVISYINVMLAQHEHLARSEVQKLVRYIHSLTSLHDILLEEVKSNGDGRTVRLDRILNDVLSINAHNKSVEWEEIPELITTPRKAATLSLILNELLDNAAKFGEGAIQVTIKSESDSVGVLEITNLIAERAIDEKTESRGLRIVELLAKADLQSALEIETTDRHRVRLKFPVTACGA